MLLIILQGLITGVIVSMSFGAGFFTLVQTSINRGVTKAMYISSGVIFSDFLFILLSVFATSFISEELVKYESSVRLFGMIALVLMGVYSILHSVKLISSNVGNNTHYIYYALKGFLINTFNPLCLLSWIGISLFLQSALQYHIPELIVFFCAVVIGLASTQFMICYFAKKLKKWISERAIHRINIAIGSLLIAIGLFIYFGPETKPGMNPMEKAEKFMNKNSN